MEVVYKIMELQEEFHAPKFAWFFVGFHCSYFSAKQGALCPRPPFLQSLTILNPMPQDCQRVDTTLPCLLLRSSLILITIPNILWNIYICHALSMCFTYIQSFTLHNDPARGILVLSHFTSE